MQPSPNSEQYGNNRIEADHSQLKRRLRPMRHLRNDHTASVIVAAHALVQNLRRGHYHLTHGLPANLRLAAAFDDLTHAI
jgi:transposase-like protein